MKILNADAELLIQPEELKGIYQQIELAGRVSYKSENKIIENSAEKFVNMLIKNGHTSVLEHGTVYLYVPNNESFIDVLSPFIQKYINNPYSILHSDKAGFYITTNLRVIIDNHWETDLKYIVSPQDKHERRYTVKFICSRGIANEFIRHRKFSVTQESTRYCNYSKDKFNKEVSFINSVMCPIDIGIYKFTESGNIILDETIPSDEKTATSLGIINSYYCAEQYYMSLLNKGVKPQIARDVLPLGLKTELIMTGLESQWKEFFKLRCSSTAHPDAQYLADKAKKLIGI